MSQRKVSLPTISKSLFLSTSSKTTGMNGHREKEMPPVNGTNLALNINDEERFGQ